MGLILQWGKRKYLISHTVLLNQLRNILLWMNIPGCNHIKNRLIEFQLLVKEPPLWFRVQSSWLQIQRCRRYQILWEVMSLERDPLGLQRINEELLNRENIGCALENRD
jgi:hypothetical protein